MSDRIDEWFAGFNDMALRSCEGDFQKADYMLNCSVFEFYSRIVAKRRYVEWHNERIKNTANG